MRGLEELKAAFARMGGDPGVFSDPGTAHVALAGNDILSLRETGGMRVEARRTRTGIEAALSVEDGARLGNPVHLCFGVLGPEGLQEIKLEVVVGRDASVLFVAHCVFPEARKVRHLMDAAVRLCEGASMGYTEAHYHGPYGGVEVSARAGVEAGRQSRYRADFSLLEGRAGVLGIDYSVTAGAGAVVELLARVFGRGEDAISISEKVSLMGEGARGLVKSRVALKDDARAEVTGITEGNAPGARGHVDCMEVVRDRAQARAVPLVYVSHPGAKVTHEAAIGSIDERQLETLLSHGLSPEEAVDLIVKGMLG